MKKYMLYERERKILYILNSVNGIMTCEELAKGLGISKRTIRNDITNINQILENSGISIQAHFGKGYALNIENKKMFQELLSDVGNLQTREARVRHLILQLINNEKELDVEELEEEMYISHSTLEKDIKKLKEIYSEQFPYIQIIRKGKKITLEDAEAKKREILIVVSMDHWKGTSGELLEINDEFHEPECRKLLNRIKKYIKKYQLYMDDYSVAIIMRALAVLYARLIKGKIQTSYELSVQDAKYQKISEELLGELEYVWELEINPYEKIWFANMLERNQAYNYKYRESLTDAVKQLKPQDFDVTRAILEKVQAEFEIDFTEDRHFIKDFALMIDEINHGFNYKQTYEKTYLYGLRNEYPYIARISSYICSQLELQLGKELDQEKIDLYLIPILSISYKHLFREKRGKLSALLVTNLSYSLSYYLYEKLQDLYGNRMSISEPMAAYDKDDKTCENVNLIISTVEMKNLKDAGHKWTVISPLLKGEDRTKIDKAIERWEKSYPAL